MKKVYIVILAGHFMAFVSCRPELKDLDPPSSKIAGIQANWQLSRCVIADKSAIIEETMDVTDFFSAAPKLPNISFTIAGADTTYSCDTTLVPLNLFGGTGGKWRFDDNLNPSKLFLLPNGSSDTITLPLLATIRETDPFLKVSRSIFSKGKLAFNYNLTFIRK